MSTASHTPGRPWKVVRAGAMTYIVGPDCGERVATVLRTRDPSNDARWTRERVEANARLIAAAPDMLDALREIQDRLLWNPQDTRGDLLGYIKDAQDTLSAILAKLEGR